MKKILFILMLLSIFILHACTPAVTPPADQQPNGPSSVFVETLLASLTLEEKVGQMLQAEEKFITPEEVTRYNIGSILSGGGSHPNHETDDVDVWFEMVARYQRAALESSSQIPLLYGTDAVHGHNNVYGATIFPHNINLGMANDADLMRRIGEATAAELKVTGIHWNFSPAVSVVEDIRWGRTYEGFSEDVSIHHNLVRSYIAGLQSHSVVATAKHFVGDGGTEGGQDQGNANITDEHVRLVHLPPFIDAIEEGVSSIMISYSSIRGQRMHGSSYWITDILKEELGFQGIVLSDWNAIYQLDGDLRQQIITSVNAGIDMLMLPYAWRDAHDILIQAVNRGDIPMSRIDDALRRILTVKYEHGLFDDPLHRLEAETYFASPAHRALAREAAAASFVLLEHHGVLPLRGHENVYLTGPAHHNVGLLSAGWTLHWQGTEAVYFGSGQTFYDAMIERLSSQSGRVVSSMEEADVVIVVFAEKPYTEWFGDTPNPSLFEGLAHPQNHAAYQEALRAREAGKTVIGVIASGRPLLLGDVYEDFDALIAIFLPGSEGGPALGDVLYGEVNFKGRLSFTWPKNLAYFNNPQPANILYPFGYGLSLDE